MEKHKFLFVMGLIIISCGTLFAQYKMQKSVIASGNPWKMGSSYVMGEGAIAQTAVTKVEGDNYVLEQGYIHSGDQVPITFAVQTKNADVYGSYDTYAALNASNYIRVTFWSQGIEQETDPIYDGTSRTVIADIGKPYTYMTTSTGSGATERWVVAPSSPFTDIVSQSHAGTTVTCHYYQQFKCNITIDYYPDGDPLEAGYVNLVSWRQCNTNISGSSDGTGLYDHGTHGGKDWSLSRTPGPQWADGGSRLEFPNTTTGTPAWTAFSLRVWDPVDKTITKFIIYNKPPETAIFADMLTWRGYQLVGIPLFPLENVTAYRTAYDALYDPDIPTDAVIALGDQDAVLYDDFGRPGMFENWWRVTKFYPQVGGYRRYRRPAAYYAEGNVEPFYPGVGFWLVQDRADVMTIDVYGPRADHNDDFPIGLGRINSSYSTSLYNMVANPFFNYTGRAVHWEDVKVAKYDDRGASPTYTTEIKTLNEAYLAGWIDKYAQVYRSPTGYHGAAGYMALPDPVAGDTLKVWEGFWVKLNTAGNPDADSIYLLLKVGSARRVRPSPEGSEIVSSFSVRIGVICEAKHQADYYNYIGYREYVADAVDKVYTSHEMPEWTYPEGHLRMFIKDGAREIASKYSAERSTVMSWDAVIDARYAKGEKIVVNWDTKDIPPGMTLHLKDPAHDKWIDMLKEKEYSFVSDGRKYNVEIIAVAPAEWVSAKDFAEAPKVPLNFYLNPPTPNPFNSACRIEFGLSETDAGDVSIDVYDINGRHIKNIIDASLEAGNYRFTWNGDDETGNSAPSAIYLIRFEGAGRTITKKVSLIK